MVGLGHRKRGGATARLNVAPIRGGGMGGGVLMGVSVGVVFSIFCFSSGAGFDDVWQVLTYI